jgi:hypothetical protein
MAGSLSACSSVYLTEERHVETRSTEKIVHREPEIQGEPELQVAVGVFYLNASIVDRVSYYTAPRRIANHPILVSLPQFQCRKSYFTNENGVVQIPISEFVTAIVSNIPNLGDVLKIGMSKGDTITVDFSTEIDGKTLKESGTISFVDSLQAFRDAAQQEQRHRQEAPADLVTEVAFSDETDFILNQALDAGEQSGKLKVTVRNQGKGIGFDVQLQLQSDNPDV